MKKLHFLAALVYSHLLVTEELINVSYDNQYINRLLYTHGYRDLLTFDQTDESYNHIV